MEGDSEFVDITGKEVVNVGDVYAIRTRQPFLEHVFRLSFSRPETHCRQSPVGIRPNRSLFESRIMFQITGSRQVILQFEYDRLRDSGEFLFYPFLSPSM